MMRSLFSRSVHEAGPHSAGCSRARYTWYRLAPVLLGALACSSPSYAQAYERKWQVLMSAQGLTTISHIGFGCRDYSADGCDPYDNYWGGIDWSARKGGAAAFYRTAAQGWDGPEGIYTADIRSHIAPGASKTWDGVYAWVNGVEMPGSVTPYVVRPLLPDLEGLQARLVLDYVPPHLGYTGPTEFELDLNYTLVPLPVPNVTDPLLGTRMHITVTMVPEPSSLLALSAGLAGMAGALRRRLR